MLLVHDLNKEHSMKILSLFPSKIKVLSKEIDNIHPCCGCFKCWTETPGKCIINDSYTEMPKYILESDTYIIVTKIYYGCYSPYIKNVIDRSIGILLPFFKTINGELHHTPRYDKFPKFIVIGYGDNITPNEELTFKSLVKANSMNNLCIINGSPRKEKGTSSYLINELVTLFNNKVKSKEYYISSIMQDKNLFNDIIAFDKILFVSPLYADCFPSTMIEFMIHFENFLKNKHDLNIPMYGLVNCGFLEGTQNSLAIDIFKNYCEKIGFKWRIGVGIGGGEFMTGSKNMPLNCKMKSPVYNAFLTLKQDIENDNPITNISNTILVNAKMPKLIFKLAGNMWWKTIAKKNDLKSKDLYKRIY